MLKVIFLFLLVVAGSHAKDKIEIDWEVTTIDEGYDFSFTVVESSSDMTPSDQCDDQEEFGSNDCEFKAGDTVTVLVEATIPEPGLSESARLIGDFDINLGKIGLISIPLDFNCALCGEVCDISIEVLGVQKSAELTLPDCPVVGEYSEVVQFTFEEGMFDGQSGEIEGDIVIRESKKGGRVFKANIEAEFG
jgi:hypothetical protein